MAIEPKQFILGICRALGLFRLARFVTRDRLRVLCYHGFSLADEHLFRPQLFITLPTLQGRLAFLSAKGFHVLPLGEALDRLGKGTLPPNACVVTIDDGFYGVKQIAAPAFREADYPFTVYVTTYYCQSANPVFRLAVQYLVWKSGREADIHALGVPEAETDRQRDGVDIPGPAGAIIRYGETSLDESGRAELAARLASQLGLDYEGLRAARTMTLLDPEEVAELSRAGVDIQLHTHTHRFPEDAAIARAEIEQNERILGELVAEPPRHFCYPSGHWSPMHDAPLRECGVVSATTCESGLATRETHPYRIPRVLDGENLTQLDFESELSGFADALRWIKRTLLRRGR